MFYLCLSCANRVSKLIYPLPDKSGKSVCSPRGDPVAFNKNIMYFFIKSFKTAQAKSFR